MLASCKGEMLCLDQFDQRGPLAVKLVYYLMVGNEEIRTCAAEACEIGVIWRLSIPILGLKTFNFAKPESTTNLGKS